MLTVVPPQMGLPIPKWEIIRRVSILLFLIVAWILLIVRLATSLPPTEHPLKIPHSIADVRDLTQTLQLYAQTYYWHVFSLFCTVFLFKQSFGIPGAALLNILGGTLYGFYALPLAGLLGATGSSIAYLISEHLIGVFIFGTWVSRQRLHQWRHMIDMNKDSLLYLLISLRILPLIPGWLLNLSAPFLGIPLSKFFISTGIGLTPFHFICIQAASTISSLNSISDVLNIWVLLKLACIALIALIPLFLKSKVRLTTSPNSHGDYEYENLKSPDVV